MLGDEERHAAALEVGSGRRGGFVEPASAEATDRVVAGQSVVALVGPAEEERLEAGEFHPVDGEPDGGGPRAPGGLHAERVGEFVLLRPDLPDEGGIHERAEEAALPFDDERRGRVPVGFRRHLPLLDDVAAACAAPEPDPFGEAVLALEDVDLGDVPEAAGHLLQTDDEVRPGICAGGRGSGVPPVQGDGESPFLLGWGGHGVADLAVVRRLAERECARAELRGGGGPDERDAVGAFHVVEVEALPDFRVVLDDVAGCADPCAATFVRSLEEGHAVVSAEPDFLPADLPVLDDADEGEAVVFVDLDPIAIAVRVESVAPLEAVAGLPVRCGDSPFTGVAEAVCVLGGGPIPGEFLRREVQAEDRGASAGRCADSAETVRDGVGDWRNAHLAARVAVGRTSARADWPTSRAPHMSEVKSDVTRTASMRSM